jgi:hypothetical protein
MHVITEMSKYTIQILRCSDACQSVIYNLQIELSVKTRTRYGEFNVKSLGHWPNKLLKYVFLVCGNISGDHSSGVGYCSGVTGHTFHMFHSQIRVCSSHTSMHIASHQSLGASDHSLLNTTHHPPRQLVLTTGWRQNDDGWHEPRDMIARDVDIAHLMLGRAFVHSMNPFTGDIRYRSVVSKAPFTFTLVGNLPTWVNYTLNRRYVVRWHAFTLARVYLIQ